MWLLEICTWKSYIRIPFRVKYVLCPFALQHSADYYFLWESVLQHYKHLCLGKSECEWILHYISLQTFNPDHVHSELTNGTRPTSRDSVSLCRAFTVLATSMAVFLVRLWGEQMGWRIRHENIPINMRLIWTIGTTENNNWVPNVKIPFIFSKAKTS